MSSLPKEPTEPCPVCGAALHIVINGPERMSFRVCCQMCKFQSSEQCTPDHAVFAWNHRIRISSTKEAQR
jgi:hypothetical protein